MVTLKSKVISICFILILFSFSILNGMVDDWGRLSGGFSNLFIFFSESLWPPSWSVIEPQVYPVCTTYPLFDFTCSTAWIGMSETIKIAFVSTIFGSIIFHPKARKSPQKDKAKNNINCHKTVV